MVPVSGADPGARGHGERQIAALDLVRFLAAFSVMVVHLAYMVWVDPAPGSMLRAMSGPGIAFPALERWSWFGWIGVQVFFVLSGFVIAYTANRSSPFLFFRSRVLRLVPAAWICASVSALAIHLAGVRGLGELLVPWLHSILFLPTSPYIDNVYWTLSIEIDFYLLIFYLLCFDRFRQVEVVAAVLGLASSAFWAGGALVLGWKEHFPAAAAAFGYAGGARFLNLVLLHHGCFFALGVLLWLASMHGWTRRRAALMLVCCCGCLLEIGWSSGHLDELNGRQHFALVPCGIWLGCVLVMAASVRINEWLAGTLGRHLDIRQLGLMTYPLYLLHAMAGAGLMQLLHAAGLPGYAVLVLAMLAMLLLAWLVARYAEPALRRIFAAAISGIGSRLSARPGGMAVLFSSKSGF
jgi:peptidoglycan/LPS O-acetylase OafA/YrhL